MGVSKNNGTPKSSILIGFSIIFTIHFGGTPPIFGSTPIYRSWTCIFQVFSGGMPCFGPPFGVTNRHFQFIELACHLLWTSQVLEYVRVIWGWYRMSKKDLKHKTSQSAGVCQYVSLLSIQAFLLHQPQVPQRPRHDRYGNSGKWPACWLPGRKRCNVPGKKISTFAIHQKSVVLKIPKVQVLQSW